jgi:hypothetical protein
MTENNQNDEAQVTVHENQFLDPPIKPHYRNDEPEQTIKVVAEMPNDDEIRDSLQEMKENDGYPDSCGINSQS